MAARRAVQPLTGERRASPRDEPRHQAELAEVVRHHHGQRSPAPPFQEPVGVIMNPDTHRFAVIEADGRLNENSTLLFRD